MTSSNFAKLFNLNAAKEAAAHIKERQQISGFPPFFQIRNGSTVARLLPPGESLMSRGLLGLRFYQWYIKLPDRDGKVSEKNKLGYFTDFTLTYNDDGPSPIQEAVDSVKSIVPTEVWKEFRANPKSLFNALILEVTDERENAIDKDKFWGKTVLLQGPTGLLDYVQTSLVNPSIGLWVDPYNGTPVVIGRTGQGKQGTNYTWTPRPGNYTMVCETKEETDKLLSACPALETIHPRTEKAMAEQKDAARKIVAWAEMTYGKQDRRLGQTAGDLGAVLGNPVAPGQPVASVAAPQSAPAPVAPTLPIPAQTATPAVTAPTQAPPVQAGPNQKPSCYLQWYAKNGAEAADGVPRDATCTNCGYSMPCSIESSPA